MIKKVIDVMRDVEFDDEVELSWHHRQKPNLTLVSKKGVNFVYKKISSHLHVDDILVCEDGYKIVIKMAKDSVIVFECNNMQEFATIAYEIGNRHQPICIKDDTIIALDDISLQDVVKKYTDSHIVKVEKSKRFFAPNAKANHTH